VFETPAQRLDKLEAEVEAAERLLSEARAQIIRAGGRAETGTRPTTPRGILRSPTKSNLLKHSRYAWVRQNLSEQLEAGLENEKEALEQLKAATLAQEAAYREFLISTVEPRVEAAKLRFQEHQLRATLSSASIVAIVATTGILLPSNPTYLVFLVNLVFLGIAFVCLFTSIILSLSAMKKTSLYVERTLIRGDVDQPRGPHLFLTRHTFTFGLAFFTIFFCANLVF
jgi:hypothetical protein